MKHGKSEEALKELKQRDEVKKASTPCNEGNCNKKTKNVSSSLVAHVVKLDLLFEAEETRDLLSHS